ncbi:rRNA small subunit 7-methylguanosine (m7G) methyltransferase GidB [Minicystis rosea]|nr:rRNA small subunit 7-methylguanosine (m7G) methyltransferase GidB [Minicystis rosea]
MPADLGARLTALGVALDEPAVAKLASFLALLLAMNEQMNLTAITTPEAAWSRHALDALSLVPHLAALPAGARVLDVGSGGGVPGLPIAIARPDLQVTLLDATEKKIAFLSAAAAALGLANVKTVCGRAEAIDDGPRFDAVTARAVAKIATLLAWTAPFCKPGGRLLFIKGERAESELNEAKNELRRFRCTHEQTTLTPTGRVVVLRVG